MTLPGGHLIRFNSSKIIKMALKPNRAIQIINAEMLPDYKQVCTVVFERVMSVEKEIELREWITENFPDRDLPLFGGRGVIFDNSDDAMVFYIAHA